MILLPVWMQRQLLSERCSASCAIGLLLLSKPDWSNSIPIMAKRVFSHCSLACRLMTPAWSLFITITDQPIFSSGGAFLSAALPALLLALNHRSCLLTREILPGRWTMPFLNHSVRHI